MAKKKIAIVGAGPSGLILAKNCSENGACICIYDDGYAVDWKKNLCFWKDELSYDIEKLKSLSLVTKSWNRFSISTHSGRETVFQDKYILCEGSSLQKKLHSEIEALGIQICTEKVQHTESREQNTIVYTQSGQEEYDIVVDCTGDHRRLISTKRKEPKRFQLAFGEKLHLPEGISHFGWQEDQLEFMGFRDSISICPAGQPISFVYILPLSEHVVFIEETILETVQDISFTQLQERLQDRKRRMGLTQARVIDTEYCRIEMGAPLPERDGPLLAFGAAAGCTNPMTGYQFAHAVQMAPKLAKILTDPRASSAQIRDRYWRELWPLSKRHSRVIYQLCLRCISDAKPQHVAAFFDVFFSLPQKVFLSFLQLNTTPLKQYRLMFSLFLRARWQIRKMLLRYVSLFCFNLLTFIFHRETHHDFIKYNTNR